MGTKREKGVLGVGTNDADYPVTRYVESRKVICPFYRVWVNMLHRCYSANYLSMHPTYLGCTVHEDWHVFSVFKVWMEGQDWEGNQLDKDLLVDGNKVYSQHTCLFVSQQVNTFTNEMASARGLLPVGVYLHRDGIRYAARVGNFGGGTEYLGLFNSAEAANRAYLDGKLRLAKVLAAVQTNIKVSSALLIKYESANKESRE